MRWMWNNQTNGTNRFLYPGTTPSLILLITHSLYFMQLHTHTFILTLP